MWWTYGSEEACVGFGYIEQSVSEHWDGRTGFEVLLDLLHVGAVDDVIQRRSEYGVFRILQQVRHSTRDGRAGNTTYYHL